MKICVLGNSPATSGQATAGFTLSLSAILGQLAGHPTLLIDMSERPEIIRSQFNIDDARGLGTIVSQYDFVPSSSDADHIPESLLISQIQTISPKAGNHTTGKSFDLLAGPVQITPDHSDRIKEHRGVDFIIELMKSCTRLNYQFMVIDLGRKVDSLPGMAAFQRADLAGLAYETIDEFHRWLRQRFEPDLFEFFPGMNIKPLNLSGRQYAFPHPLFTDSLRKSFKPRNGIARVALEFAEQMRPSILKELTDINGQRIRPYTIFETVNKLLS